jgi:Ca-activated chloride channel family protein
VVAAFAEKLRGSYWVRDAQWPSIEATFAEIPLEWQRRPEVAELGVLINTAARLDRRSGRFDRDLEFSQMDFDRLPVLD